MCIALKRNGMGGLLHSPPMTIMDWSIPNAKNNVLQSDQFVMYSFVLRIGQFIIQKIHYELINL